MAKRQASAREENAGGCAPPRGSRLRPTPGQWDRAGKIAALERRLAETQAVADKARRDMADAEDADLDAASRGDRGRFDSVASAEQALRDAERELGALERGLEAARAEDGELRRLGPSESELLELEESIQFAVDVIERAILDIPPAIEALRAALDRVPRMLGPNHAVLSLRDCCNSLGVATRRHLESVAKTPAWRAWRRR